MPSWGIQNIDNSNFMHYYTNNTAGQPNVFGGPWGALNKTDYDANPLNYPDASHYHVENAEEAYAADLASAKTKRIDTINQECHSLMQPTDWMAIRAAEGGAAVPGANVTHRAAMRTEANNCVSAINALTTVNQCRDYAATWPSQP